MTICIAALCQWNHGPKENPVWGNAVVTAADRMFTDAGLEIQYEGGQGKWGSFGRHVLVLVADKLPIQSQILRQLHSALGGRDDVTASEVAGLYGDLVLKFRREEAEKLYLAPFGMTMESFAALMQANASALVSDLADRILNHSIAVEAIVTGVAENDEPSLFHIDNRGIVTSHADVGFVSIGSGHSHANAFLMARGYWNRWPSYNAVCAVYAAKMQAQNAPGVGRTTDMHLITKEGWTAIAPEMRAALEAEYPVYKRQLERLEARMIDKTWKRAGKAIEKAEAKNSNVVDIAKK